MIKQYCFIESIRFFKQAPYPVTAAGFLNFFFDNKKPTFTGKSVLISEKFKKTFKNCDSSLNDFESISSNTPNPLKISIRFNV